MVDNITLRIMAQRSVTTSLGQALAAVRAPTEKLLAAGLFVLAGIASGRVGHSRMAGPSSNCLPCSGSSQNVGAR
jgi:hypothetical protein